MSTIKCPFCAETIQAEAIKCKHCSSMLNNDSSIKNSQTDVKTQTKTEDKNNKKGITIKQFFVFLALIIFALYLIGSSLTNGTTTSSSSKTNYYTSTKPEKTIDEELEEFRQNRYNAQQDQQLLKELEELKRYDEYRNQ